MNTKKSNDNMAEQELNAIVKEKLNCNVTDISVIGKGASGSVYKLKLDSSPFSIAVKISNYPELLQDEYERIRFISDKVECKLPKLYFIEKCGDKAFLGMELIEGVEANKKVLLLRRNKEKLANEIVDNLIKIHSVHNDKFGPVNNAVYNSWFDYYSEFAKEIVEFTNESDVPEIVKTAVNEVYKNLFEIIGDDKTEACLTHGDYWLPNFIVDPKTMSLKGVIDPFNVMWAEPEYELFAMTVGYGNNLHLYDIYKSKIKTSPNCDVKVELYALFNELLWYKTLGKVGFEYLEFRSKRLLKKMKYGNYNRNHLR